MKNFYQILGFTTFIFICCFFAHQTGYNHGKEYLIQSENLMPAKIAPESEFLKRIDAGTLEGIRPLSAADGNTRATMIGTTKGIFFATDYLSGNYGAKVEILRYSNGNNWLSIEGSSLMHKLLE